MIQKNIKSLHPFCVVACGFFVQTLVKMMAHCAPILMLLEKARVMRSPQNLIYVDLDVVQEFFSIFFVDLLFDKCIVQVRINVLFFFHFFQNK